MKLVTFARSVASHGKGDKRLVPDDLAKKLDAAGDISAAESWPPAPQRPTRAAPKPGRPAGAPDSRMAR
jgi:hypothetical protein